MKKILLAWVGLAALLTVASAQTAPFRWVDPLEAGPVVHGVGWDELKGGYVRLPERAHGVVRESVWNLGRNAAGLSLVFESDAPEIIVLYLSLIHI